MKRMIGILLLVLTLSLSGCKKENIDNINKYIEDKDLLEYNVNTTIYTKAIEDIIFYSSSNIEDIEDVISEFGDIMTDSFKERFRATGHEVVIETMNPEEEGMFSISGEDNSEDESTETGIIDSNIQPIETEIVDNIVNEDELGIIEQEGDAKPADETIVGDGNTGLSYNIISDFIAYAISNDYTEDEPREEYNPDDEPVFQVIYIDAYNDRLIATVSYKYGSTMKVWVALVDGKIDGYTIYR